MRLSDQPLRRQTLVASALLVVPLLALVSWAGTRIYRERADELRDQATSTVATAKAYLDERLAHLDSIAGLLARHPAVIERRTDETNVLFRDQLRHFPFLLNVALVDREGRLRGSGVALPAGDGDIARERRYVQQVLAAGRPVVGEYSIGSLKRPRVILGYPVPDRTGAVVAVLGLAIRLDRFGDTFASIPLPAGSVVALVDRNGTILARNVEADAYIGKRATVRLPDPSTMAGVRTLVGTGTFDGVERIYGQVAIDRGPWVLSVGIPTSVALTRAVPSYRRNVLIVLLAFGLSLAFGLILARGVARPLRDLESAASRIGRGDYQAPAAVRPTSREVSSLRAALVLMARDLQQTHAALDRQLVEERRVRAQVALLQRQTVRQERLAAVGQLVSGVAHEVNNPLQAIVGATELLEAREPLSPAARGDLKMIRSESQRAGDIIRNLLRFAGQQPARPELVNPADVVDSVVQLRRRALETSGIAVEVSLAPTRHVRAVFSELQQVLLNFVINAEQALTGSNGGRLRITCVEDHDVIRIDVADSGPGVRPEDEPKLFQPFFTTKPMGQGTGLGLSVSYGIIESLGGEIGYHTNEWGGATFYFVLPAAADVVTV
jgi:C4-dicarboxylate-specific signal transduction histidine kinase